MSVHIYLRTRDDWRNHPDWAPLSGMNGGHKHFVREVMGNLPSEDIRVGEFPDFDWLTRPTDFAAWRAATSGEEYEGSTLRDMIDILEREPTLWIYVSQ